MLFTPPSYINNFLKKIDDSSKDSIIFLYFSIAILYGLSLFNSSKMINLGAISEFKILSQNFAKPQIILEHSIKSKPLVDLSFFKSSLFSGTIIYNYPKELKTIGVKNSMTLENLSNNIKSSLLNLLRSHLLLYIFISFSNSLYLFIL